MAGVGRVHVVETPATEEDRVEGPLEHQAAPGDDHDEHDEQHHRADEQYQHRDPRRVPVRVADVLPRERAGRGDDEHRHERTDVPHRHRQGDAHERTDPQPQRQQPGEAGCPRAAVNTATTVATAAATVTVRTVRRPPT